MVKIDFKSSAVFKQYKIAENLYNVDYYLDNINRYNKLLGRHTEAQNPYKCISCRQEISGNIFFLNLITQKTKLNDI